MVLDPGVSFDTDGVAIDAYGIRSLQAIFTGEPANNLGEFQVDRDDEVYGHMWIGSFNGRHFLGDVIGGEFDDVDLFEDLTFWYTIPGGGGDPFLGTLIIPEPSTLVIFASGALGLLLVIIHRRHARRYGCRL